MRSCLPFIITCTSTLTLTGFKLNKKSSERWASFFKKKLCERWAYKDNYTHHGHWLPTPPHTQKPKSCVTLHDGVATWQVGLGHLKNGHFLSLQIFNFLTNTRQILLLLCGAPSKLLLYPHLLLWKGPVIISKARKREDPAHFVVAAAWFQSWTLVCGCRVPFFIVYRWGLQVFKSYHTSIPLSTWLSLACYAGSLVA